MGKGNKKRRGNTGWDDSASDDSHGESAINGNEIRAKAPGMGGKVNNQDNGIDGRNLVYGGSPDPEIKPDFGHHLEVVENLKTQMDATREAMAKAHISYTKQQRDIQNAEQTRRDLTAAEEQCRDLKTTYKTLLREEKEKDDARREKEAAIEKDRRALERDKEQTAKRKEDVEAEREKIDKRAGVMKAQQEEELLKERINLEQEQNLKFEQRVKDLEMETKKGQEDDRKRIAELEVDNIKLLKDIEKANIRWKQAESKLKDVETLKIVWEERAEKRLADLKLADNEFGLNAGTTEYYKEKFSKIYSDIERISSKYLKEMHFDDLNALHDQIEQLDDEFAFVPISESDISAKLLVLHVQRVISAQLLKVIWQPFSPETIPQDPGYVLLFARVSEGLLKRYGKGAGLRAARLCKALTVRGLQSHGSAPLSSSTSILPSQDRAHAFCIKAMELLELLVKPSLHVNLRKDLLNLAVSAISIWDFAQTDEREVIVDLHIDLTRIDGWHEDITAAQNEVHVLFPRIIALGCSRTVDSRPIGPPGGWVESEPSLLVEETCIHDGVGLAKWSQLVTEGVEEEELRKEKEEYERRQELKRAYAEKMEKLDIPVGKRRMSIRESTISATPKPNSPKPSSTWGRKGGQTIDEDIYEWKQDT